MSSAKCSLKRCVSDLPNLGPKSQEMLAHAGITGIAQFEKLHALDHAAVFDIEAGNDADFEHGYASAATASATPMRPS